MRDGGRGGRFAAGDTDDAEDSDFAESGARDEDAVGIGVEVGRSDLDAVVDEREQMVGATPSRDSPSRKRRRSQRPSSLGRLRNALRSGSKSSSKSRTK